MHHKKTVFLLILAVRPLTRRKYMFCKWLLISIILPSNTANATRPLWDTWFLSHNLSYEL